MSQIPISYSVLAFSNAGLVIIIIIQYTNVWTWAASTVLYYGNFNVNVNGNLEV